MKSILIFFLSLTSSLSIAQNAEYKTLLDSAKTLFKSTSNLSQKELDEFDYTKVATLLNQVLTINPESAEAHYYLGYTYSRINSRDGRGIIGMNLTTLYKSSEQFEKVIELSPKYTGELVILDPYSKLTAEWGSMAMYYWYKGKADSAIWAFMEGKKRGGFSDFVLQTCKMVLTNCNTNSILISQGDNFTFPLWYLQIVEQYRRDVSVVDISLLNTRWFPQYLYKTNSVVFNESMDVIDTIEHSSWKDSSLSINGFTWLVKPSFAESYLLRGDKIFLSLFRANNFKRKITFTTSFSEEYMLGLKDYTIDKIVISELSKYKNLELNYKEYVTQITRALKLSNHLNINSQDDHIAFDNIRYNAFRRIYYYMIAGEKTKAKTILKIVDKYADERKFPYYSKNGKEFYDNLKMQLN